jgi:phosphopantothenoylcysteine decarboxylase/phosphopantothenate--cysteine ligase
MEKQVLDELESTDIFISAAAVADYRCFETAINKIKKDHQKIVIELEKNPDILAMVARSERKPYTVGFAAETESLHENALNKLNSKGLDMIAANQVGEGQGFNTEENSIEVLWHGGSINLGSATKHKLARKLIQIIADKYHEKSSDKSH